MNLTQFKHKLGTHVRETVSGFEGIVTGNLVYLNGCKQCLVRPKLDPSKPNDVPDGSWFDEQYLEATGQPSVVVESSPVGRDTAAPRGSAHG